LVPSSTKYTSKLCDFYGEINGKNHSIEIIYVSYDKNYSNYKKYTSKMPWLLMPYQSKFGSRLKLVCRCQELPHLTVLRKDGSVAAYDGVTLINKFGAGAFTSLLKSEGGMMRTFAPLKVTFDYMGYLKDKYR
jgi:hypothetical protein